MALFEMPGRLGRRAINHQHDADCAVYGLRNNCGWHRGVGAPDCHCQLSPGKIGIGFHIADHLQMGIGVVYESFVERFIPPVGMEHGLAKLIVSPNTLVTSTRATGVFAFARSTAIDAWFPAPELFAQFQNICLFCCHFKMSGGEGPGA